MVMQLNQTNFERLKSDMTAMSIHKKGTVRGNCNSC